MFRLLLIPSALLALLAGAVVWSNKGQGKPADFTFVNRGENKTLDIGVMSWMQDIRLAYALYEGLYTPDPVTLEPIPGAADPIDISDDKCVYMFHIRANARWSDGTDLTAGDFAFGWRRMLEQPSEYTYLFDYIRGARKYGESYIAWKAAIKTWHDSRSTAPAPTAPDFGMVGIAALDAKTFKVTLEHPVAYFPAVCAFPPFFPEFEPCMRRWAQKDESGTYVASYDETFTRPPNLVTNGPYRLTEWSFKRRVRIEASEYYWNRATVKSRVIDQLYADDPLSQYRMYQSGVVDWLADVDGDMAADLRDKGRNDLKLFPAFGTYFYTFNCNAKLPDGSRNPFADRRVRRAFTMSIDKRPIVNNITRTGEPISTVYVPKNAFKGYQAPPGLAYDVAEAKRLMADAGYPGGVGFPALRILFNSDFTQHGEVAQVVRPQWQQNLGVDLELEGIEMKVFGDRLHKHDYAIARGGWYGDYGDPSTFTDVYKSTGENNNPQYQSPEYDALLQQAEKEKDPATRLKTLSNAENLLLEDAPLMPLYQYVGRYLIHDNVRGIPLDARQMIMMQAIEVRRGK